MSPFMWVVGAFWTLAVLQSVAAITTGAVRDDTAWTSFARVSNAVAFGAFMAGWRPFS